MDLQQLLSELLDHARGMWRFRWHALAVAWIVAIPGWSAVYRMPDVYEASAKVMVDTNSLLPALTQGLAASENLIDEVGLVSRALLTRPNLAEVARKTDLDLRAETPLEFENLVTRLQKQIKVAGGSDNVFKITFQDYDREKSAEVVATVLDTFVESSLGAQGDDSEMTERALTLEIEDHEQRLIRAESDLANFKRENLGYMPGDGADYYTRLQSALSAVEETERQIRLVRNRRDEVARQLEGEEPVFGLMPSSPAQAAAGCSKAGTIAGLENQLSALLVDFTEKHPRAVMLQETITSLKAECDAELTAMGGRVPVVNPETNSLDANPVYQNLRLQLSNHNIELAALQEELGTRRRQVAQLRRDVDKISEVETSLKQLNRDYGVVEGRYQELLRRWETLQSRNRLDTVTDKVQFRPLEPPFVPEEPIAPNRPLLLVGVLVFAIGAGGAIAFALNQIRPVFYTRRAVTEMTGLPVLGSVGLIMSPTQRAKRRLRNLAWMGANLVLFAAAGAIIVLEDPIANLADRLLGGGVL